MVHGENKMNILFLDGHCKNTNINNSKYIPAGFTVNTVDISTDVSGTYWGATRK